VAKHLPDIHKVLDLIPSTRINKLINLKILLLIKLFFLVIKMRNHLKIRYSSQ
jgi:hypothetical protein